MSGHCEKCGYAVDFYDGERVCIHCLKARVAKVEGWVSNGVRALNVEKGLKDSAIRQRDGLKARVAELEADFIAEVEASNERYSAACERVAELTALVKAAREAGLGGE